MLHRWYGSIKQTHKAHTAWCYCTGRDFYSTYLGEFVSEINPWYKRDARGYKETDFTNGCTEYGQRFNLFTILHSNKLRGRGSMCVKYPEFFQRNILHGTCGITCGISYSHNTKGLILKTPKAWFSTDLPLVQPFMPVSSECKMGEQCYQVRMRHSPGLHNDLHYCARSRAMENCALKDFTRVFAGLALITTSLCFNLRLSYKAKTKYGDDFFLLSVTLQSLDAPLVYKCWATLSYHFTHSRGKPWESTKIQRTKQRE